MVETLERSLTAGDFEGILLSDFQTPEMIQKYFSAKLKEYLGKNGRTVQDLSRGMSLDSGYLSDVLDGKKPFPRELAYDIAANTGEMFYAFFPLNHLQLKKLIRELLEELMKKHFLLIEMVLQSFLL